MIPFHIIYSWLFKSFRINGETELIQRLKNENYKKIMIIKRSWIFALFTIWIPLLIMSLGIISIIIAYSSISIIPIRNTIIGGNILMMIILTFSSVRYVLHFRQIHKKAEISSDLEVLEKNLSLWDSYFINFFNWSITNQLILVITMITEIVLIIAYQGALWDHFWILMTDIFVMITEIYFLKVYRKRMIYLEMDYNIIVPWKIFFVNQSWVLSSIQSIEWSKIKTVRSAFPSKIASFFDYGTVDVLTEWDSFAMMWVMSMYYVTDPDWVVSSIQMLLKDWIPWNWSTSTVIESQTIINDNDITSHEHAMDTRGKVRDVLR